MPTRQVQLIATLTTDSTPLSGKTITFQYKLSTSGTWNNGGSAQTDSNGNASVTLSLDAPNTYDFQASFAGDDQYESATAQLTGVTVKAKTTLTLKVVT